MSFMQSIGSRCCSLLVSPSTSRRGRRGSGLILGRCEVYSWKIEHGHWLTNMYRGVAQWVAHLTLNVSEVGLSPIKGPCCFLRPEILPSLLSTCWSQEQIWGWFHKLKLIKGLRNERFAFMSKPNPNNKYMKQAFQMQVNSFSLPESLVYQEIRLYL